MSETLAGEAKIVGSAALRSGRTSGAVVAEGGERRKPGRLLHFGAIMPTLLAGPESILKIPALWKPQLVCMGVAVRRRG